MSRKSMASAKSKGSAKKRDAQEGEFDVPEGQDDEEEYYDEEEEDDDATEPQHQPPQVQGK